MEAGMDEERDFRVTLENNLTREHQVVVARGLDAGLAAQAAMRARPGWTARHDLTTEGAVLAPTDEDLRKAEQIEKARLEADARAQAAAEQENAEMEAARQARAAEEAAARARGEA